MSQSREVFMVEHRQHMPDFPGDPASFECTVVHVASTREKAIAWCRKNLDWMPKDATRWWWFVILKDELDSEEICVDYVHTIDWDGNEVEDPPVDGYPADVLPRLKPGGSREED